MSINWNIQIWNTLTRLNIDWEWGYVTDRQMKIFNAIKNAYITARSANGLGQPYIEQLYVSQMRKAEEDELRRIEDIALLFFAAMFKFGEE